MHGSDRTTTGRPLGEQPALGPRTGSRTRAGAATADEEPIGSGSQPRGTVPRRGRGSVGNSRPQPHAPGIRVLLSVYGQGIRSPGSDARGFSARVPISQELPVRRGRVWHLAGEAEPEPADRSLPAHAAG